MSGPRPTAAGWEVTTAPKFPVKTVHSAGAEGAIDPYTVEQTLKHPFPRVRKGVEFAFAVKLFCAENAVAGVAEAGDDVAMLV